jgi:hypothetical protein
MRRVTSRRARSLAPLLLTVEGLLMLQSRWMIKPTGIRHVEKCRGVR